MIQLAAWLLICLATAWLLRRRPELLAGLAILCWTLVPAIAGYRLTGATGGPLGAHPATWLVLCGLAVQVLTNVRSVLATVGRHPLTTLVLAVFTVGAGLTSVATGSGGSRLLLDQIVGPFALWLLVVSAAAGDPRRLLPLRNLILVAAALQCVIAAVQFRVGAIVLYERDFERLSWFRPEQDTRWMGTADNPLTLAVLLCVAGGLALGVRRTVVRLPLLALFLVGTLIAEARAGTAVLCLILLFAILRPAVALGTRAIAVVLVGGAAYLSVTSSLATGIAERLVNDTGSTAARLSALRFMAETAGSYLGAGQGLTSSYGISRNAGLQTSLESSYLMYVVDVGLILATLYFGLQVVLLLRYGRHGYLYGATAAALVGIGLQHGFSGVAGSNLTGTVVWAALAIVVAGSPATAATPDDQVQLESATAGSNPPRSPARAPESVAMSVGS